MRQADAMWQDLDNDNAIIASTWTSKGLQLCRRFALFQLLLLLPLAVQVVDASDDQTEAGYGDQQGAVLERQLDGIQAKGAHIERVQDIVIEVASGYFNPDQGQDGGILQSPSLI